MRDVCVWMPGLGQKAACFLPLLLNDKKRTSQKRELVQFNEGEGLAVLAAPRDLPIDKKERKKRTRGMRW